MLIYIFLRNLRQAKQLNKRIIDKKLISKLKFIETKIC